MFDRPIVFFEFVLRMADDLRIRCGNCQAALRVARGLQGRMVECGQCGHEMRVPVLEEARQFESAKTAAESQPATKRRSARKRRAAEEPADDTTAATSDPWDVESVRPDDYNVIEASRRRRRKIQELRAEQSERNKKPRPKKNRGSGDVVKVGSIVGGFGLVVGGIAWFLVGWMNGEVLSEGIILVLMGIAAFINGVTGK